MIRAGGHQVLKEAAAFAPGHLLVVEQAHRSQDQHQAAWFQNRREGFLKEAHQLVGGEGPGHVHPGQRLLG